MAYAYEFKIGDLVSFKHIGEQVQGVIVDVATVNDGPDYTYKVEWRHALVTIARWFTADKLELVSVMKFKLGDFVKVNYYDEIFPGNIVEVARVIRRYKVRIMYTDGRTKEIWFNEDEIVDGFTPGEEGLELKPEEAFVDKKTGEGKELRAVKMEVTEFYRNVHRLCDSCGDCRSCPLYDNHCAMDQWGKMSRDPKYLDQVVEMVKDWAAEHPVLTNRDVLIKVFGKDISESVHPGVFHIQDCADDGDCKEWLNVEYTGPFKLVL